MRVYINYRAGAGGDFLKVALWLLMHPEIEIDWKKTVKWKPAPVNHVKPVPGVVIFAEHGSTRYRLCGLLDDGSIKPATILSSENVIQFGNTHGFKDNTISNMALLYSQKHNVSVNDALIKMAKAQIQNIWAEDEEEDFENTVIGSHYTFNNELFDIEELYKSVTGASFDKIISILPKKPSESLLIRHLDVMKNFGRNHDQTINETFNDLQKIIQVMENDIKARNIAEQRGYGIIPFKKLHCSTALELVAVLSEHIEGLKVSEAYLSFHKKYTEINNIETLLKSNKLRICDETIEEYMKEVDKWVL